MKNLLMKDRIDSEKGGTCKSILVSRLFSGALVCWFSCRNLDDVCDIYYEVCHFLCITDIKAKKW